MILILSLLIALVINFILFLFAFRSQSDKLTDFSYTLSFITIAITAFILSDNKQAASLIAVLLVLAWGLRLGIFLVLRVRRAGKDTRFDDIRHSFFKFLKFWLAQAVVAWVLLLPLLFLLATDGKITGLFITGIIVWLLGFIIEAIADYQKYRFTGDPKNKGKWIDEGIWHYSRHPNYFGEITVWVGMYILAFSSLTILEQFIGLLSPLVIAATLLFVSGVPILEKSADKKWGTNKAYKEYKKKTSLLVPLPKF